MFGRTLPLVALTALTALAALAAGACASSPPPPAAAAPAAPAPAPAAAPSATVIVSQASVPPPEAAAAASAAVDAADRSPEDRALDAGRHPAQLLAFAGVAPGQKVAELFAGGGYTTELLARAVGPQGRVYGQNTKAILERFAEKPWSARLAKPVNASVVRVDRELDDPLPPEAQNLDAVLMVLVYHDAVWLKADRARMNAAVFRALRPGGAYVIVDHSARAGTGTADAETLHRIDETVVKEEVARAGFRLLAEADFLRNPADPRDWSASPRVAGEKRGTSDRFVLKFVKP